MKELRRIVVPLETVTPLWMGGAGSQPELRPPSMRGCLRFWLRALLGGTLGEDLPLLRAAEGAVFGSTVRASPIVVRLDGSPETGPATLSAEEFPGACYMFWSTYQRKRDAFLPGQTCQLQFHGRVWEFPHVEVQGETISVERSFHYAAAALWLLLRLGGVGARVRRGGGVLRSAEQPTGWPESVPSPMSRAATPDQLAAELADGLNAIRRSVPWQAPRLPRSAALTFCIRPFVRFSSRTGHFLPGGKRWIGSGGCFRNSAVRTSAMPARSPNC